MDIEIYISLTATAISVSAFGVAIWQGWVTRRHNHLSVKPFLYFDKVIKDDDYIISLKNAGIGPAIITKFEITYCGENIGESHHDISNNFMEKLKINHLESSVYLPGKSQALSPNDEIKVLKIQNIRHDIQTLQRIVKDIQSFEIKVKYESIYGTVYFVSLSDSEKFV